VRFFVYYRRAFDERDPARPDYAKDYERGEDVDAGTFNEVAMVLADKRPTHKLRERPVRQVGVGDVVVDVAKMDARILTQMGLWAKVPPPPITSSDAPEELGRGGMPR
jgi:hypothetical protein